MMPSDYGPKFYLVSILGSSIPLSRASLNNFFESLDDQIDPKLGPELENMNISKR